MFGPETFDVAIIGGGVIGCALARRFTLAGTRVVLLERALEVLDGASTANSAILHTGFDAATGSLEAACSAAGYAEYLETHPRLNLPLLRSAALVLGWGSRSMRSTCRALPPARWKPRSGPKCRR